MNILKEALDQFGLSFNDIATVDEIRVIPHSEKNDRLTTYDASVEFTTRGRRTFLLTLKNCCLTLSHTHDETDLIPHLVSPNFSLEFILERKLEGAVEIVETTPPKRLTLKMIEALLGYKIELVG